MRFATKGLAVMPMKILSDPAWVDALAGVVEHGRALGKEVVVHTHFNHPNEISEITQRAVGRCIFARGIYIRNQTVLMRGVNDDAAETMLLLVKRLEYINVHPYYVYMHDLVQRRGRSTHHRSKPRSTLRNPCAARPRVTTRPRSFAIRRAAEVNATCIRSNITIATTGISVWTAPSVKPGKYFVYFDPLDIPRSRNSISLGRYPNCKTG